MPTKYKTDAEKLEAFEKRKQYAREHEAKRRREHPEIMERIQINYWKKKLNQTEKGNGNHDERT